MDDEGIKHTPIWNFQITDNNIRKWVEVDPNVDFKKVNIKNIYRADDDNQTRNPGAKTYDEGKEPLAWLPWGALDELAKVQQYGHKKYGDFNNYRKGLAVSRNLSCALRHIRDYMEGHDVDAESGLNPLAHALCRIAFVLQNIRDGVATDDRYKK